MLGYKYRGLTAINRRKDRRIPISIPGMANGTSVVVKNISLGGLAFIANKIKFDIGEDVLLELHVLGIGDITIGASIVRAGGEHEYGVAFIGLSSDAFKLIETLELGQHRRHILRVA
jgi:PilZ domain